MEGYKRRNLKDMNTTLDFWAGSVFCVQPPETSFKQLPNHLKKVEDSIMNNLQLESLKSKFVCESYGIWKMRKLERNF